jgi:hypothetical protein
VKRWKGFGVLNFECSLFQELFLAWWELHRWIQLRGASVSWSPRIRGYQVMNNYRTQQHST